LIKNQYSVVNSKTPKKNHSENFNKSDYQFPVVGIGASAGGLEAFKALIKAIPKDSGMAYVLVQHLAPDHESLLPEILQKVTNLPVLEVLDEVNVEPNHIYVMPSNKTMVAAEGKLQLTPRQKKSKTEHNLPIDRFFISLAEIYQELAIGVVLSGTASDGTSGLRAIRDNGGITFAQDEESAQYDGMPRSAVEAGVVDFVLSPGKIPAKLLELTNVRDTITAPEVVPEEDSTQDDEYNYRQIVSLIRIRKGTDFTYYKQTTIRRRILRRMAINNKKKVASYLNYLRKNREEQDLLYRDFLIPVTSFFRDPESFEQLREKILPLIKKNKPAGETIRIWVAGCSTGEEAYSMAICFKEFLDEHASSGTSDKRVQIFATDLNESAIDKARSGTYSKPELAGLSEKQLKQFFTKLNGQYQVNRLIRDMCVFACHNLLNDPPFGKMDLISCRNVLIYMEPYLQKKALTTFHYALNSWGYLFLGKSETTSEASDLYLPAEKQARIFARQDMQSRSMHMGKQRSLQNFIQPNEKSRTVKKSPDFQKRADDIMLRKYTPAGVVINENMDIVQFRGKTSDFLEQTSGRPSHNLFTMAKQGLAFELRNLVHKLKNENKEVRKENIPIKKEDGLQNITIEAVPLPDTIEPYYLILFKTGDSAGTARASESDIKASKQEKSDEKEERIQQLEQELVESREDMRSITEDQEAAYEELQSANEELQSANEELQSLNEELETSKEELQSTNEELIVVNKEMESLNEKLAEERNYSEAIVENIREPLLVLDKSLRIRTANKAFFKLFRKNDEDTEGRLIYDLDDNQWDIPELRTLLEKVIPEKSVIHDFEMAHTFPDIGEVIMLLNAREVISESTSEKLILLSIEDITEKEYEKRKRREIQEKHTKELEEKIDERTIELKKANEELLQKNEDLVKMNKELETFAYISSHDLQEPLRKIQTFADRIVEKEIQNLSEKGKAYFEIMQDAAGRMQKLIEDLLAFSRLTISEREFETVNLNKVIKEVLTDLKVAIKEKKAVIEIREACKVNVVVFQFRQLIHNLLSNALKFSKPGEPPHVIINCRIRKGSELEPEKLLPDKKYCHISVTDNGIGFEEEFREKIFEVFQKLHNKEEYPGTGIGLATVKKIVDTHQGLITATSEINKGTTFDIYIPAHNN
jgi:two-component system, chemotaxis family, CheB/CheR fusion protein